MFIGLYIQIYMYINIYALYKHINMYMCMYMSGVCI